MDTKSETTNLEAIDDIIGSFTEFNGNTFICDDPVALAKEICSKFGGE